MFLGLPRWTGMRDTPSVVQVDSDGTLRPFPGGAWNDWAFGKPVDDALVQVNALHVFGDDTLWVVDQGAPDGKATLPGARTVLQFDTGSRELLRALRFGAEVQPLRGSGRRVLVDADGGRLHLSCTFLEISPDGEWLYFSTPTGPFRRVPTALLCDAALDDDTVAAAIEEVVRVPSIYGSAMDSRGNLYLANAEQRCIEVVAPTGRRAVLAADERLVGPGAPFITRDRRLFVAATQAEFLPECDGGRNGIERPFLVLSMALPDSVDGIELGNALAPELTGLQEQAAPR